jgi:hypothetical protein
MVAGAGLWDAAVGEWAEPPVTPAQSTSPGALGAGPRVFDLAFNRDEPNSLWHDTQQANDLAAGTVDRHAWDPFATSRSRVACAPGPRVETFTTRLEGGPTWATDEGMISLPQTGHSLNYAFRWHVQPLGLVLPPSACRKGGTRPSMDLFFHPANTNHNGWTVGVEGAHEKRKYVKDPPSGYAHVTDLARRYDRVFAGGMGAGEGWNYGDSPGEEAADHDAFRAAARRYRPDPDRVRAVGMSGRIGAAFFAETWPDRISSIASVSYHDADSPRLVNLRNTPWVFMHGTAGLDYDGLTGTYFPLADRLRGLGYEYAHLVWHGRGHDFTLLDRSYAIADAWTREPRHHPARLTYRIDPAATPAGVPLFPGVDWARRATLADPAKPGTLDVTTLGLAGRLPRRLTAFDGQFTHLGTGDVLQVEGLSYDAEDTVRGRMPDAVEPGWTVDRLALDETAVSQPAAKNGLTGTLAGISALTIDVRRAGLDLGEPIDLSGLKVDRPVELRLRAGGSSRSVTLTP